MHFNFIRTSFLVTVATIILTLVQSTPEDVSLGVSFNRSYGPNYKNEESHLERFLSSDFVKGAKSWVSRKMLQPYRNLGDFDELNELLSTVSFVLPPLPPIDVGLFITAYIDEVVCSQVQIEDLEVSHELLSDTVALLDISVEGLGVYCEIEWRALGSKGTATVSTRDNSFNAAYSFYSPDFKLEPPNSTSRENCVPDITINDIDATGGVMGSLLNTFEILLRSPIESAIKDLLCPDDTSQDLIVPLLNDLVAQLDELLEPYLQPISDDLKNPLLPEEKLIQNSDQEFLGFSSDFGMVVKQALDYINSFFGNIVVDPNSPNGNNTDLAINQFLRNSILNENRALFLNGTLFGDIYDGDDQLTDTKITIDAVYIYGLDTLLEFVPISGIGEYTLASAFEWQSLDFEIVLNLQIEAADSDGSIIDGGIGIVTEQITIKAGLKDVEIDFAAMVAVSIGDLTSIEFGALTNIETLLSCLSDSIYDVEISNLSVMVSEFTPATLDGFISTGIDEVVSSLSLAFFDMYEGSLIGIMPYIFQVLIRGTANDILDDLINDDSLCWYGMNSTELLSFPDLMYPKNGAVIRGGTGQAQYGTVLPLVVSTLLDEVKASVYEESSINLNGIIANLTIDQSGTAGTLNFPSSLNIDTIFNLGDLNLSIVAKIYNTTLANLHSLGLPFDPLQASAPQLLESIATLGTGEKRLKVSSNIMFSIGTDDGSLTNDFQITIEMTELLVNLGVLLLMFEEELLKMPISNMANMNCLMSTLSQSPDVSLEYSTPLSLEKVSLEVGSFDLDMNCNACSTGLSSLVGAIDIANALGVDLTEGINSLLDTLLNNIRGNGVYGLVEKQVKAASYQCPSSKSYDPSFDYAEFVSELRSASPTFNKVPEPANNFILNFIIAVAVVIAITFVVVNAISITKSMRVKKWKASENCHESALALKMIQKARDAEESKVNMETSSLFTSPCVPFIVRGLIPIIILGNIGLFLSGHLSLGAQVDLIISIAGDELEIKKIFDFSLAGSIKDMWEAGAKELAIMIIIFSGIWPYLKQSITLFLWFASPKIVKVKRRGTLLIWLDVLGKWSFIDIFVLLVSLVGFRIAVNSPQNVGIDLYGLDIVVIPRWGLYANMLAQLLSQISSHFVIHFHRTIVKKCLQDSITDSASLDSKKESLRKYSFHDSLEKNVSLYPSRLIDISLSVLTIVTITAFMTGLVLKMFSIESFGLIGIAIEAGQNFRPALESYSFFDIVKLIFEQAKFLSNTSDYIGLSSLVVVFLWTVLIVPILQLLLLVLRWTVPMSDRTRNRSFVATECLMAWQYSEVFILSIIIAAWQLGPVSEYMINDYCGFLTEIFEMLVSANIVAGVDGQCFRAEASVENGAWFLSAGALCLAFITHFITKAASQRDLEEYSYNSMSKHAQDTTVDLYDEDGLEDLKYPPTFTDFYRWALKRQNTAHDNEIETDNIQQLVENEKV